MYFDSRLWMMMAGLRLRVAGAVGLGLLAMGLGILRFVFLGRVLALAFKGAPPQQIALAAAATVACMLLRAGSIIAASCWPSAPPGACRRCCAHACSTASPRSAPPGSARSAPAA